jgi:hypothetical protein
VLALLYAGGSVHRLIPQWHERVPEQRAEAGEQLLSRATVPQLLAFKTSTCGIQCCVRAKQQQQQQGHAAAGACSTIAGPAGTLSSSSVLVSYSEQQLKMFAKGLHTGIGRE